MIYLDYNATAPIRSEVVEAMMDAAQQPCNPSSVHKAGREAKRLLETAREAVAYHVGCFPNEVIFCASGSEANNMALRGFPDRPMLVSATEHSSVIACAARFGGDTLPVDANGLLDLDALESKLKALGAPAIVSVMLANNETGVIQPIRQIADLVHRYDGLLHCDAVQMLGKGAVDMGLLGADMLTLCAHKMGGPVGIGALILRNDVPIKPLIVGGNQELGRRASTENVAAAVGFAKALELSGDDGWLKETGIAMRAMEAAMRSEVPRVIFAGEKAQRLPHVTSVMLPGVTSETQLMHLDLAGFCVSAGSACSSGRIAPSHVLKAMGFGDAVASSVLRVSAGWATKPAEIESFTQNWLEMAKRIQSRAE